MVLDEKKFSEIKEYIKKNYVQEKRTTSDIRYRVTEDSCLSENYSLYDDVSKLKRRVESNINDSWQQALFNIIDKKFLDEVEVYKRGGLTKQTFSKIRSNADYHPDKDTAIRLCIGLKLNLDETLDLLSKAGYTLSNSIERDLVIKYFIENKEYDIYTMDNVFEELGFKTFLKY